MRATSATRAAALAAGSIHSALEFGDVDLLLVEEGFVVVRALCSESGRAVVADDARAGMTLLPPGRDEVLEPLVDSRVSAVSVGDDPLARALLDELRRRREALGAFGSVRHVVRVRRRLLQLARDHGRVTPTGVRIDFRLTHELLGEMVGSVRETVTRALDELEADGFVRRDGHAYMLDLAAA